MPQTGHASRASSSVNCPTCWPIRVCRMAGKFSSCCLISWCDSAQPWHRCNSFFWLFSTLVRCTVAGFEQNWHFTPRPSPRYRGGPRSTLFELADAVAQAGGLLVGLLADRLCQLLAQLHQL